MEQLASHAKVFVAPGFLEQDVHGSIGCHECHGGEPSEPDLLAAHAGVVRDPTKRDAEAVCGPCHEELVMEQSKSLHFTCAPIAAMIGLRAGPDPELRVEVQAGSAQHCGACHASCGQCHVSRPAYVQGGLLDGHFFQGTPPMREVCTACHGSRVEREYFGLNQGLPPDVHWRKRFFRCVQCHGGDEMHAATGSVSDRYQASGAPQCVGCHQDIYADGAENRAQHEQHRDRVSCQVCHAVGYKNCYGCHLALDKHGFTFFRNDRDELDFRIGFNPDPMPRRPEIFVVLRHVPVAPDTFAYYAGGEVGAFDALPTWKPATPHNIQRKTPQGGDCNACHGSAELFLTAEKVDEAERKANSPVIVPEDGIPARQ